ncbi:LLM class flavin-dependent oxidoreductase [Roseiarcaceae bacterium H3SJ34-1]|uniref:LLM class flavin-dependent oxidoreductase n=1 Tax=Terripilifer ovatus TaxID=3032367 RepID=UPI003AB99FBE|nr:LLM class flavin-dependent oxidoreductase [Roseiarcaceae bacterium H3SJ34-1]
MSLKFGYFTLSDNRYPNNPRTPEQFHLEIRDQAILAEKLGYHSAWIGEHHFNRRGCVAMPSLILANIAAVTTRIRLSPAVVVLPIHHPIYVAEEWATLDQLSNGRVDFAAGRGYDSHEYTPFGVDFQKSAEHFAEGIDLLMKCWKEEGPFSYKGQFYNFDDLEIHPKPLQKDFRPYMASFSRFSMELAADWDWNLLLAPFASTILFGDLGRAVQAYREICEQKQKPARKVKCSYFIHIGDKPGDDDIALERMINYITMAGLRKTMSQGGKGPLPPTMQYFTKIGEKLNDPKKGDFDDNSLLFGSPQRIIETLKRVEANGLDEVILYFNFGNARDAFVRDQMQIFAEEIAPAFSKA